MTHNSTKEKVIDEIERFFQMKGSLYFACDDKNSSFSSEEIRR